MTAITECLRCNSCSGAAYLWPPILYAGKLNSPILVIAQNPGDFTGASDGVSRYRKQREIGKRLLAMRNGQKPAHHPFIKGSYDWDFGESYGAKQLARVFGSQWLEQCCYTNAVLCRTPNNAAPSLEMQASCRHWTLTLLRMHKRKLVVAVGAIARDQAKPIATKDQFVMWGQIYRTISGSQFLAIRHYAAWSRYLPGAVVRDHNVFRRAVTEEGINYVF